MAGRTKLRIFQTAHPLDIDSCSCDILASEVNRGVGLLKPYKDGEQPRW